MAASAALICLRSSLLIFETSCTLAGALLASAGALPLPRLARLGTPASTRPPRGARGAGLHALRSFGAFRALRLRLRARRRRRRGGRRGSCGADRSGSRSRLRSLRTPLHVAPRAGLAVVDPRLVQILAAEVRDDRHSTPESAVRPMVALRAESIRTRTYERRRKLLCRAEAGDGRGVAIPPRTSGSGYGRWVWAKCSSRWEWAIKRRRPPHAGGCAILRNRLHKAAMWRGAR